MKNRIMESRTDKEERKYSCGYCGRKFVQFVGITPRASDTVVCPRCGNNAPRDSHL